MTQPTPPLHAIVLTYIASPEEVARLTPQHRAWLDQHYRSGLFLVSGRQSPAVGGFILARGESKAALESVLAGDPFNQAGVATYQIVAFTPSKRHASFPYPELEALA